MKGQLKHTSKKKFLAQAESLTTDGHKTNQQLLKDMLCARLGIAAAPGAIPQHEWDEIYNDAKLTYRYLRLYTYNISYAQCYVRSHFRRIPLLSHLYLLAVTRNLTSPNEIADAGARLALRRRDSGRIRSGKRSIKNERDKWTMSALDIDELRSLGYTGDDPVTRADFEELVATQIVRIPTTHEVANCSFN
jgi:hypothetical protein